MLKKLIKNNSIWLALLLTGLSSFFVFHHLGERAFWLDEADVAIALERNFVTLFQYAIYDGHPLPYIYSLKTWSLFSGTSEFALRSFSAFFAVLFVPAIYLGAKRLFNNSVALWSATIAATNYFLIWYGTQNKGYSFIAFYSLLSTFTFIRLVKNVNQKNCILYTLICGLGIYFHPWFIFVLCSHLAVLTFIFIKTKKIQIVVSAVACLLLTIPGILIVLYQGDIGISSRLATVPLWTFWSAIGYLGFGLIWAYVAFAALAISIFVNKKMLNPKNKFLIKNDLMLLSVLAFFSLFLGVVVSGFKPAFEPGRYEIITLPAFILLLGAILSLLRNKLFFISALIIFSWVTHQQVINEQKTIRQYKSTDKTVSDYLLRNIQDNDLIITTDLSYATFNYYLKRQSMHYNKNYTLISFPEEISLHPGWKDMDKMLQKKHQYSAEAEKIVSNTLSEDKNIWVIYSEQNQLNEILLKEIEKNYTYKKVKDLPTPYMNAWYHKIIYYTNDAD